MTTGENSAHLADVYDADVSWELISRVTGSVPDEMEAWRQRPLDRRIYPVVFIDAVVMDLARRNFVFDIARLEQFCRAEGATNGIDVRETNDRSLWTPPTPRRKPLREAEFRLHERRTLTGRVRWGGGYPPNDRELSGTYPLVWRPAAVGVCDAAPADHSPGGAQSGRP